MSEELDIDHDDELDAQLFAFWDRYCAVHAGQPGAVDPQSPWDAFAFSWPDADAAAIDDLLSHDDVRKEQIAGLNEVGQWLGQGQFIPSERAAEAVLGQVRMQKKVQV